MSDIQYSHIVSASCTRSCLRYGSENMMMKVDVREKLDRAEMIMTRQTCGLTLKETKKSAEFREMMRSGPVSFMRLWRPDREALDKWNIHTTLNGSNIVQQINNQRDMEVVKKDVWGRDGGILLNPVYTIQPVVKPAVSCKQTSNRWSNGFGNRVERTAVRSTGCQTELYNRFDNGFDNWLYRVYKHLSGCETGLTTGCIV